MRIFSILALILCFATSLAEEYPVYPSIRYGTGPQAEQIKRGEYLVKAGDCIACHTEKGGTPFAGGYAINTPFGKIFGPNLTSDTQHGIGAWTDAEFIKAMREGINPHGEYLYPAFPYLFFNRLTDADLLDIKAYLNALPPSAKPRVKNDLIWPFSWRFVQLGWRALFFYPEKQGPYIPDPQQSETWNRGAYLVQGLGHCSMCHSPSYYVISKQFPLAAPATKYYLTGNSVEGYFAPDITHTLMEKASNQELKAVFRKDKMIGGGDVQGPMLEANHDSLQYLTDSDVEAIATYLRTVRSQTPPKISHGTGLEAGAAIYDEYCTGCHTTGAGGAPKLGDSSAWEPKLAAGVGSLYSNAIHGINGMPAKGTCSSCTDQDIHDAVDYIVSVSQPGGHSGAAAALTIQPVKPLTLAEGKVIYEAHCASCHAPRSTVPGSPIVGDKKTWKPIIHQGMDIVIYHAIRGYGTMPPQGGCHTCSDADIKAAVKYMVEKSKTEGDYTLW